MSELILASQSKIRQHMLKQAGVVFISQNSQIDERKLEASFGNIAISKQAMQLAIAKAKAVSVNNKEAYVVGCDQMLEFENSAISKATNLEQAFTRLESFSGKTHFLHSAAVLMRDNVILWSIAKKSQLTMRCLTNTEIKEYLQKAGVNVLNSVGCYEIEGLGVTLFEKIEGSMFDIMGLPLLELLAALREKIK